jgi:VanZ family protein
MDNRLLNATINNNTTSGIYSTNGYQNVVTNFSGSGNGADVTIVQATHYSEQPCLKIQHFAAYGGMMLWWVQLAATRVGRVRTAAWLIALGIGLEIAQSFTGYREASILDACANTAGVLLGWALAPPRLPDLLALATRLRARLGG